MLHIYAFGRFELYHDDEPLQGFATHKAESLFCYLALNPHRPHAREVLAELLWDSEGVKNARNSLNTALWRIRDVLRAHRIDPDAYLVADRDQVRFNPEGDYWCDVETFRKLLSGFEAQRQGEDPDAWQVQPLYEALDLYRADLLDGLYDDWCLTERERLQQLLLRTLAALVLHHQAMGQYDLAIVHGQHILSLDPLREEVHREVMRCNYLAGRRADALRQFEACRAVLDEELGVEPMPETLSLYHRISLGQSGEGTPSRTRRAIPADQAVPTLAQLRTILQQLEDAKRQVLEAMQAVSALNLDHGAARGRRDHTL